MDWIHCNKCYYQLGHQPKRGLLLTSCGHIICKSCERSEQVERCKICSANCSTIPLAQMPEDIKVYFENPESTLEKILKVHQFQKTHRDRLNENSRTLWEKYQKLKIAFQKLDEDNIRLRKEVEKYRKGMMTSPLPPISHNNPLFNHYSQPSPFLHPQPPQSQILRGSPSLFPTPARSVSSAHNYRNTSMNTPSTPSDSGVSPGSVVSQRSYRSEASSRSGSQQRMYRPGLTPPINRLSLLSVGRELNRESSRY